MTINKISRISYGGTAAIVTSMTLITGLNAVGTGKSTLITALLVVALADNITDSLSIHIYQESERLDEREAFIGTLSNFTTRLLGSLSFVLIVLVFPPKVVVLVSIVWGNLLLGVLTYFLARERNVRILPEVIKHLIVAAVAISTSKIIAHLLT